MSHIKKKFFFLCFFLLKKWKGGILYDVIVTVHYRKLNGRIRKKNESFLLVGSMKNFEKRTFWVKNKTKFQLEITMMD